MSHPCLIQAFIKGCAKNKTAKKEVNKVVKCMKSAVGYTRSSNGSANTIQAAATQVSQEPYGRFTAEEKEKA